MLEEVRRLVAADGADLEPDSSYENSPLVELTLIIPTDGCEECVLSRDVLEELAVHMFQDADPTVLAVRVRDPREQRGPDDPTPGRPG